MMMSCRIPPAVQNYIDLIRSDKPRACPEQVALVEMIQRIFDTEHLVVNEERLAHYLSLAKYFPFKKLLPWEEFIVCLWLCTYDAKGFPRFKTSFNMVGRGAGKDGLIGFVGFCMVSPYNPVPHYNIDICANNEEQAITPLRDVAEVLETPKNEKKLNRFYYHTKEVVQGRKNKGVIKGRTNNPKGRDGMRSGMVVFNEVHQFTNYDNITVFITGQGKVAEPRVGIFTSNGDVSDGPLDDYLARSRRILFDGEPDNGFLPFICCLEKKEQVHDPANWYMANPSLFYMPHLQKEIEDEYTEWVENPDQNSDFLTKRMGVRSGRKELAVTDYENVKATNQPLPDLTGWSCVVGIDYAELTDWAAVNLHFRQGPQRFDISHAWICRDSKTLHKIKAPWRSWVEAGHCTFVEDVSIHPRLLADYIQEAGRKYSLLGLAMDNYRWTMLSAELRRIGFDANDKDRVHLVRPSDIMRIDPIIQDCFQRHLFCWGDNPALRWAVNNTKRVRSSKSMGVDTGNFIYAKIEARSRKTDPWMALVASMTIEDKLGDGMQAELPSVGAFIF